MSKHTLRQYAGPWGKRLNYIKKKKLERKTHNILYALLSSSKRIKRKVRVLNSKVSHWYSHVMFNRLRFGFKRLSAHRKKQCFFSVLFFFFLLLIHVVIQQNHLWDFNSDTKQTLPMFHGTFAHILFLLSKNGKHGENRVQIEHIVSLDKEMWLYSPYVFSRGSRINQRRGNGGAQYFAVRSAETSTTLSACRRKQEVQPLNHHPTKPR